MPDALSLRLNLFGRPADPQYMTLLFASPLYEPPDRDCDYFRDLEKAPFTHDFNFLHSLLKDWPETCGCIRYYENDRGTGAFRFQTDDGVTCLPISKRPSGVPASFAPRRDVSFAELERCFLTRFFQFRLIKERERRLENFTYHDRDAAFAASEEVCEDLGQRLRTAALDIDPCRLWRETTAVSESRLPQVFCPLDGWVTPEATEACFQNQTVFYLLCPHCLGNFDFQCSGKLVA